MPQPGTAPHLPGTPQHAALSKHIIARIAEVTASDMLSMWSSMLKQAHLKLLSDQLLTAEDVRNAEAARRFALSAARETKINLVAATLEGKQKATKRLAGSAEVRREPG